MKYYNYLKKIQTSNLDKERGCVIRYSIKMIQFLHKICSIKYYIKYDTMNNIISY